MDEKIKAEYYDPKTGFVSAKKIYQKLKAKGEKVKLKDVERVLGNQSVAQMFKPLPNKYKQKSFRPITAPSIKFQYQVDLLDVRKFKTFNNMTQYLMNCVDVYSRYAMSVPMKNKTKGECLRAFKVIVDKLGAPTNLNTDLEKGMMGPLFQKYLAEKNITHFKNDPELKRNNSIVERFNRTLRERLAKYFLRYDTRKYLDELDNFIENYNTTRHTTTKEMPAEIWKGKTQNKQKVSMPLPQKFKVGDVVRILKYYKTFTKMSDVKKFSQNLYTIKSIEGNTYILQNERGTIQRRKAFEIQKVDPETVENITYNTKGDGKKIKKEVEKQQAQRRFNKAGLDSDFIEKVTQPLDAKRKQKKMNKLNI